MNWSAFNPFPELSLQDLEAAAERIRAMPQPETDITVSPDVWQALLAGAHVEIDGALQSGLKIHIDALLPARAWHHGIPGNARGPR